MGLGERKKLPTMLEQATGAEAQAAKCFWWDPGMNSQKWLLALGGEQLREEVSH
jgi:hypothetical protein